MNTEETKSLLAGHAKENEYYESLSKLQNDHARPGNKDQVSEETETVTESGSETESKQDGNKDDKLFLNHSAAILYVSINKRFQMSRLSAHWYDKRNKWLLFIPSIIITSLAAVGAFVIKSDLDLSDDTKSFLALAVGVASIFTVFLQNLSNELGWDHAAKSHKQLSLGLHQLLVEVRYFNTSEEERRKHFFAQEDVDMNYESYSPPFKDSDALQQGSNDNTTKGWSDDEYQKWLTAKKKSDNYEREKVKEMEKLFSTIMKQNSTETPAHIVIAYELMATRLSMRMFPPVKKNQGRGKHKSAIDYVDLLELANNELYFQMHHNTKVCSWLFPYGCCQLRTPNPEEMVKNAFESLSETLAEEGKDSLFDKILERQQRIEESEKKHGKRTKLRKNPNAAEPKPEYRYSDVEMG